MIFENGPVVVRKLTFADAGHLTRWLSDPQVLAYYEGRDRPFTYDTVLEKFFHNTGDTAHRCLVSYKDMPIGYIQYYLITDEENAEYGYTGLSGIYGMDQFIGEPAFWNRGIGTLLVSGMVRHLFETCAANRVVMDPQAWNVRAIRCYEKCGFRTIKALPAHEWHEGEMRDCWLIAISREEWFSERSG